MKKGIRFQLCMVLCFAMLASFSAFAQSSDDVKIGTQTWTSKNLDVSTFRNGEAIPEAKSKEEWSKAGDNKTAAFCYYEYDSKNGKVYGKLYNWYAVNDSRGLAPAGYHIPSDAEWTILTDFLGGSKISGKKMKSKDGWSNDGNGDNSSGYNGLPGGNCNYNGYFHRLAENGYWWSSSENKADNAWDRNLDNNGSEGSRNYSNKRYGFSVRCLRD